MASLYGQQVYTNSFSIAMLIRMILLSIQAQLLTHSDCKRFDLKGLLDIASDEGSHGRGNSTYYYAISHYKEQVHT